MHTHTFAAYWFIAISSLVASAKAGIIGGNGNSQDNPTLQNQSGLFNIEINEIIGYHKASGEAQPGLFGKRSLKRKLHGQKKKK